MHARSARTVFLLETGLVLLAVVLATMDIAGTLRAIRACTGHDGVTSDLDLSSGFVLRAGLMYAFSRAWVDFGRLVTWWLQVGRPWQHPNPIAFSGAAVSGSDAWEAAARDLLNRFPSLDGDAKIRVVMLLADYTALVLIAIALLWTLTTCNACGHLVVGTTVCGGLALPALAGAGVASLYYDLRVKFPGPRAGASPPEAASGRHPE